MTRAPSRSGPAAAEGSGDRAPANCWHRRAENIDEKNAEGGDGHTDSTRCSEGDGDPTGMPVDGYGDNQTVPTLGNHRGDVGKGEHEAADKSLGTDGLPNDFHLEGIGQVDKSDTNNAEDAVKPIDTGRTDPCG